MSVPLAVAPGILTPGVYMVVDLLAGAASPSTGTLRIALLAPRTAAGDLTLDTEVRQGGGVDSAAVAFGTGGLGSLAAKKLYGRYPGAVVDFVAVTPGAGAATLSVTLSGAPSSNTSLVWDVMGREFTTSWLVADALADAVQRGIDAINQRADDLYVTAATGAAGVIVLTANQTGTEGNDVKVKCVLGAAQSDSEAVAGAATPTNLAGATTAPDYTTGLASLTGKEYARILMCLGNTDAGNVATASNLSRSVDHINGLNTGLDAKLQEVTAGITTTIALASAATSNANGAQNEGFAELILCVNGRGLPAELGAVEVGGWLAATSVDPAANRIGEDMSDYIGAVDVEADRPTPAESETALGAGVSLISYTAQGLEMLVRAITCHSQTATGAPDRRLLDVQNVSGSYVVMRDIRAALPQEFPNAKLSKDVAASEDPPAKGVIEERDIKAFCISRLRFWQGEGVLLQAPLDAAIADGTLIVQVNDSNSTQVDIVLPHTIVPPLAKFGVVGQRVPN